MSKRLGYFDSRRGPARKPNHYGHGHWPHGQFVAIVASYWRKDWTSAEVARKLGVSVELVELYYESISMQEDQRPL